MTQLIYAACALTSIACFLLLWRSYAQSRARLLFWSAMCFAGLSVNNILLVLEGLELVGNQFDTVRLFAAFAAVCFMLYGLVMAEE